MATPRVFISMGDPYTPELAAFRDALENLLRDRCNVDPRILGKNEYPTGNPLGKIIHVIRGCDGMVVVANERKYVEIGKEKRGGVRETTLEQSRYTTAWSHVESALAYALDIPIYVISQRGVHPEGLIETKDDWFVQEIDFEPEILQSAPVLDSLRAWVDERVRPHAGRKRSRGQGGTFLSFRPGDFTLHDWGFILTVAVTLMAIGGFLAATNPNLFQFAKDLKI